MKVVLPILPATTDTHTIKKFTPHLSFSLTVDSVINTLHAELKKLDRCEPLSPVVLKLPRTNETVNERSQIARKAALAMYFFRPLTFLRDRKRAYILFNRQVSRLKKAFREYKKQEAGPKGEKKRQANLFERVRVNGNELLWDSLLFTPLDNFILPPKIQIQKVCRSPFQSFEPLFHYMASSPEPPIFSFRFERGTIHPDGRLDLCNQGLTSEHVPKLVESISKNTNVKHVLLGTNDIELEGIQTLSAFMETPLCTIETWYLAENNITTCGAILLAKALNTNSCTRALWLQKNFLGVIGVKAVADMLAENKSIEVANLSFVGMTDEGCEYLFEKLSQNTTLKMLYVSGNGITSRGAQAVGKYFRTMSLQRKTGITGLWVGSNPLTDQGVREIAKGLYHYAHLEKLCLPSVRMGCEGLTDLLSWAELFNLRYFNVGGHMAATSLRELPNSLRLKGSQKLAKFVAVHPNLRVVDCSVAHIPLEGIKSLAMGVSMNARILYAAVKQCGLSGQDYEGELQKITQVCDRNCRAENYKSGLHFCTKGLKVVQHTPAIKNINSDYCSKL